MENLQKFKKPLRQLSKKDCEESVQEGRTVTPLLTKKWLSGDEVCYLLGISKRTLQSYRDRRMIPYYQIGRKILYKMFDVEDLLEQHHIRANYQKGGAA